MDFTNIPTGLKTQTQIPLNSKEWVLNEATLAYLGINNNLAFTYHDQQIFNCLEEKTKYIWREVNTGEENTGLIPLDFTYPNGLPLTYGIDYSGKKYNFFEIVTESIPGPQGPIGNTGPQGPQGPQGIPGPIENFQKTLTVNDETTYTLTSADDKHTIFVTVPGTTSVGYINVPLTGLPNNFSCAIILETSGTSKLEVFGSSATVKVLEDYIPRVTGDSNWMLIERKLNTDIYYVIGNLDSI